MWFTDSPSVSQRIPQKASFLLPLLPSLPTPQGRSFRTLQAPGLVRKRPRLSHGLCLPMDPRSRGPRGASPQPSQPPSPVWAGDQPSHDSRLGAPAACLIIVHHKFARDLPGDKEEAAGSRGISTHYDRQDGKISSDCSGEKAGKATKATPQDREPTGSRFYFSESSVGLHFLIREIRLFPSLSPRTE